MTLPAEIIPAVSVVIPCRNEKDHIEAMMQSILLQDPPARGFEIIVADGMSDDGTREILNRMAAGEPRIRIVDNKNRIVSTGLNTAIRAAQAPVIVRMDVHTVYARDYLCACLSVLCETGADNVGGPARTEGRNYIQSAICAAYHSIFSVGGVRFHDIQYEGYVDTVTYGCWPREVFDRIGFFDEELVRNQDDELNLRLIRTGGKIWQSPRICSWYKPRPSLRALVRQYMQYGYWKVRVIQKHKMPASWRHMVPGIFVFAFLVLCMAAPFSSLASWMWTVLASVYAICNVVASFFAAANYGWKLLPILPVVFACYHFAYGYGFLRGLLDFVVFGHGRNRCTDELRRPSTTRLSR